MGCTNESGANVSEMLVFILQNMYMLLWCQLLIEFTAVFGNALGQSTI